MFRNEKGFHILPVLLIIAVLGVVGFAGWQVASKSKDKDASNTSDQLANSTGSEPDIALQNFGIASLDSVDVTTQATREFTSNKLKGFYIFGDSLSGGRINPNFEFASLKTGTKLVAAIDGVIGFIKEQPDTKDSEVFLQPKDGSAWTIGYDHVVNVAVKKGDSVKAGAVLGEPAMQNNGLTRFEIQINKDEGGITTHYCPSTLLAASVKDNLLAALGTMQDNWEKTTGLELYDLTAQNPAGCLKTAITPEQAEGR